MPTRFPSELGKVEIIRSVGGGDINEAYECRLSDGTHAFVKLQSRTLPGLFAAEAHGLAWLHTRTPRVISRGEHHLALEWLDLESRVDPDKLGRLLAEMHRDAPPVFGLDRANYIATILQPAATASTWPEFYVEHRLRPLIGDGVRALLDRPHRFGPPEPPARLHGDLWTGNVASVAGEPVVYDPAVYGGHREIDLAMYDLFGDVTRVAAAYHEAYPLADGWRDRIALYQLYPLAVHAKLFGGGYTSRVRETLATLLA
ncbi:MAG: fructosamine kinase family protein [Kofleriaceae bacterium]